MVSRVVDYCKQLPAPHWPRSTSWPVSGLGSAFKQELSRIPQVTGSQQFKLQLQGCTPMHAMALTCNAQHTLAQAVLPPRPLLHPCCRQRHTTNSVSRMLSMRAARWPRFTP